MRRLGTRQLRSAALGALVAGLVVCAVGYTASAGAVAADGLQAATGTLNMNASLRLVSVLGAACPPGVSAYACAARTSTGPFAGLGQVAGRYTFVIDVGPPTCANGWGKAQASTRNGISLRELRRRRSRSLGAQGSTQVHQAPEPLRVLSQQRLRVPPGQRRGQALSPCRASTSMSRPRRSRERPIRRCEPRRVRSRPESSSRSLHRTTGMARCRSRVRPGPEAASD